LTLLYVVFSLLYKLLFTDPLIHWAW
jgi:hypothetical protein